MTKTILYFLAFISLGLISGSLGPTIPALAAQTNSAMHEISSLFLVRSLGTMFGALLVGRLYDRVAGHPLLGASLLASAGAMALMPSMPRLGLLLLLSLFLGLASGSINVGGNAMIVQVHGERARPHMSALHFAFGLGGFLAPILYTQFLRAEDPMRTTYWTLAALSLPSILLIFATRSPHHHLRAQAAATAPLPAASLALFMLFFFLEVGAEASVMGWYFSYAAARGVSEHTAGLMNSGFWAAFTFGRLATIWLDGCSGCHMSLLDMDERLLDVVEKYELVYSPLVDVKEFPDNVDVTLVEGAVSTEADLAKLRKVRARTRALVSLGDCAVTGNIPALRNLVPEYRPADEVNAEVAASLRSPSPASGRCCSARRPAGRRRRPPARW